ncbi:MAG: biotin--[acetyl-CoA-carboxylase] ligase [Rhodospirillales bacterium]
MSTGGGAAGDARDRPPSPARLPDGYRLLVLPSVTSTNDEVKRLALAGEAAGLVVNAGEQTAGRGRQRRIWTSPPGNLYLSILLRPDCPLQRVPEIGFVAAVAVADAVAAVLAEPARVGCKWPNDVLIDGRKVAGLLLETATEANGGVDWAVLGIGLNIVSYPEHTGGILAATSLVVAGASGVRPDAMLERVVEAFARRLDDWRQGGFAPVRAAWRARAHRPGDALSVRLGFDGEILSGRFVDIDGRGALVIDTAGGRRTIAAGDCLPAPVPTTASTAG